MKVVLYLAMSVNGYIAGENDDVSWLYEGSWKNYLNKIRESNIVVVGRKTYELMPKDEFQKECQYYIFTHSKIDLKAPNIKATNEDPATFVKKLKNKNINQIMIAGGSQLNTAFLKANFIDEIYLDIEPYLLGKGIPLFQPIDTECELKLLSKKVENSTIQLHYKVIK